MGDGGRPPSGPASGPAPPAGGSAPWSTSASAAPTSARPWPTRRCVDYAAPDIECRFVSNIDPVDLYHKTHDLDPAETLFVVSSKTFTTLETLTNAAAARQWLLDGLGAGDGGGGQATSWPCPPTSPAVSELRHRPGQHVRVLGLGRRALLLRLGHRLLAHGGHRPRGVRRHAGRLPRHRRALRHGPAGGQHAGHPGHAQRLVRQPLRGRDPRRAALQPAAGPVPRLPPAADHGVQRQVGAPGRVTGVGPDRRDLLGRAGHQRPARLLPAASTRGPSSSRPTSSASAAPPTSTATSRTC